MNVIGKINQKWPFNRFPSGTMERMIFTNLVLGLSICYSAKLSTTLYEPDGRCNKANGYACDQAFPCCSKWGFCGATSEHCAPSKCLANCWPSEEEPPLGWQFKPSPLIKNAFKKNNDGEDDDSEGEELTASELGIYRAINHFPDEYLGVYVKCVDPSTIALTYDDGPS